MIQVPGDATLEGVHRTCTAAYCTYHQIRIVAVESIPMWLVNVTSPSRLKLTVRSCDAKRLVTAKDLEPSQTTTSPKSPSTAAQVENAAQVDESSVTEDDLTEARVGDLHQRLEEIQVAHVHSFIFNLLHWSAGDGLVENPVVNNGRRSESEIW